MEPPGRNSIDRLRLTARLLGPVGEPAAPLHTCKDLLTLSATSPAPLPAGAPGRRQRFLGLAACVWLNHQLGRPSRSLVAYVA